MTCLHFKLEYFLSSPTLCREKLRVTEKGKSLPKKKKTLKCTGKIYNLQYAKTMSGYVLYY